ncbi:trifunctional serine/threonine-protein kinase/ATP-binding protein/sensor histidine kinase [Paraburkholderia sp. 40]|uniref:trifunctional serine/threonine-protein kinase/ATP-binding protein/sensor histidine kinase n=1 Tax=Paraburkholderia sp. 40 TaxID=2991059 RepID=UPI003D1D4A57
MSNRLQILWDDGERVFCRGRRPGDVGGDNVLMVRPAAEPPPPASLDRLAHEFALKDELDGAWAVRPLELVREAGRTLLVLEDPGGEPLGRLLGAPMEAGSVLRLTVGIAAALGKLHQRGLVHKDLKPAHILVSGADGRVRLTGFGLASRLPRERRAPEPPETIAGTLAYMAPEQTGRMNRSIDSRSDLYSLGVTLYQMLTGELPFTAADPMEWVHCHIARKPVPPGERLETVPAALSRIVMKLLAKTAEERYQTAVGVERDLRRCLTSWERDGQLDDFPLGEHDTSDRLLIPEKLYGREREIDTMVAAFDRVVKRGAPELVLVSGYSGIGKSSVVNELHKVLVPPRGLFASGKFDQYKRDIPYSTLVQAFQSLVRPLLGKSDTELASWRGAFLEALGPNARLMTDLIPELKLIIGEPIAVPELDPQQAQSRFQFVFQRFIGVFARPEHPLALFLDDLQWLDAATLDLLEDLLTRSELRYLMLIGAYRDNEVDATHPLMVKLRAIRNTGATIAEIRLAPLVHEHIEKLIADALHCKSKHAAALAQLVHEKTAGNPFFVIQFLYLLAEEALLTFDYDAACWCWDFDRIHAKGYTENVVDLMAGRLTRLPVGAQQALQQLACLGNVAASAMLSIVLGASKMQVNAALWPAVQQELVERLEGSYRFIHDRVQEAAYSLIPETLRAEVHLRIGRLLVTQTPPEKREETIFEIVNQLNRGAALITEQEERDQLAELNLTAGRRAKAATAYASALTYLDAGAALLATNSWERRHELIFALELNRAECEFLSGARTVAEDRLNALSPRAATTIERASVACLLLDLYTALGQSGRAVAVGLDYLRHLGVDWSPQPTEEDVRREYERFWSQLGHRSIEDLIELPLMADPASLATMEVLTKLVSPAFHTEKNLYPLAMCWAVNLSLERGNSDASCATYAWFGCVASAHFGDHESAYRMGQLGCELAERRGFTRFQARTYMAAGSHLIPFARQVGTARDVLRRGFEIASRSGDLLFMGWYRGLYLIDNLLAAGTPLIEVQREAEGGLAFAQKMQLGHHVEPIASYLGLVRMLRGLTSTFGSFNDEQFDEVQIETRLASDPQFAWIDCLYHTRKLQAHFHAGNFAAAIQAASRAEQVHPGILRLLFTAADHRFYCALSHAACCEREPAGERQQHLDVVVAHHHQLRAWADNCPENFEDRAALVGAEIARLEGRDVDAMRLYEQAIRAARDNGFVQNEAIAYEVAARFYAARGFEQFRRLYLRQAHSCYLRWGANGKARQLEEKYPHLGVEEPAPRLTNTIGAPVEHLDLTTVIKVSQAVSGDIVLDKLIDTLMRTAIEQAGAERGLLILPDGGEQRIAAEATTGGDTTQVQLREKPVTAAVLPESVLYHVLRTRESVILNDAAAQPPFATDPYVHQHRARSILCLPLMNQARLTGALYLENNLMTHVFAPARIAVLKLLASQAAIALENARLYRDLAEREAKIRRLVDANIIGIVIRNNEGAILEANDAFLRIVGYDREDLVAGRVRWTELTTPESRDRSAHALAELKNTGTLKPFEKEYFRKDGRRVPVLTGAAVFEEGGSAGVAFVLDLTELKQAEGKVRESERRYREVQTELAHANRVATMGQLASSIAHEVNQPIAATVTNAAAALRWLDAQPPDVEEVRQALRRIVNDGNRAGDVIGRIRQLIRKAPPRKETVDINEAIREVIELTRGEIVKHGASVKTRLADGLPFIEGDRVELQQVLLNLVINAIEAMSDVSDGAREVLISTGNAHADCVLVTVRDSGPGFAPDSTPEHVFASFYTTKPTGLGMGLSICRSIVEAHGGQLWANANEPRGAIFQFTVRAHQKVQAVAERHCLQGRRAG